MGRNHSGEPREAPPPLASAGAFDRRRLPKERSPGLRHANAQSPRTAPRECSKRHTADMLGALLLSRVVAVGIEGVGFAPSRTKAPGNGRITVTRVADIDRRLGHTRADADRHQHRLDPVVTEAVRPAGLVEHHSRSLPTAVWTEDGRRLARVLASRSIVEVSQGWAARRCDKPRPRSSLAEASRR